MEEKDIPALFITKKTNLRYLSGFTGSDSYGLISSKGFFFITDMRYTEQAERECPDFEVVPYKKPHASLGETLLHLAKEYGLEALHFEKNAITWGMAEDLRKTLQGIDFVPEEDHIRPLRQVKTAEEIEAMGKAAIIGDRAFEAMLDYVRPGVTEKDMERELNYTLKKFGSEKMAFPIIAASGPNSSLPHAVPGDRVVEKGDFITFDFGAVVDGYRSDMTRTFVMGKATEEQRRVYRTVYQAQEAAIEAIRPGAACKDVDGLARKVLEDQGYTLVHGLGHGVGLDIHETPFFTLGSTDVLEEGNAVTVEPGIYIPRWGGVRIEELGIVTAKGYEPLNHSSRELVELT